MKEHVERGDTDWVPVREEYAEANHRAGAGGLTAGAYTLRVLMRYLHREVRGCSERIAS